MNDNMDDTELVRWIVEAELASRDRVAKLYVVELIKIHFNPTRLVNKVFSANRATENGLNNFNTGASLMFRDTFKSLSKYYAIDDEGWITRRQVEKHSLKDSSASAQADGPFSIQSSGHG